MPLTVGTLLLDKPVEYKQNIVKNIWITFGSPTVKANGTRSVNFITIDVTFTEMYTRVIGTEKKVSNNLF